MIRTSIIISAITIGCLLISTQSCYYDNAEDLLGAPICDTIDDVSYQYDITPIRESRCLICHSDASYISIGGGVLLEGFDALATIAASGALVGVTDHLAGYSPMPKSAPQLPACERSLIRNWVSQGIQNN